MAERALVVEINNYQNWNNATPLSAPLFATRRQKVGELAGRTQPPQLRGRPVHLEENFLEGWNYSI